MTDRSILYRIRAALQGGYVAVASEVELLATYAGVLLGVRDTETALRRVDGTGVGAPILFLTASYTAQSSNISEWFGGRQQTRIRFTDDGPNLPPTFTLPGAVALNTAFDQLVTAGLPEVIRFVIEYTGPSTTRVNIVPRDSTSGTPQIQGTSRILVASGVAATLEITRTNSVISDYVFESIGAIGNPAAGGADALKLINPATAVWDASSAGPLPPVNTVQKGNAYRVVNAPADGSGRFNEVMQNGDWVFVEAETFTSWSATPLQWAVLPAHEVRRITALEQDFLTEVQITPVSDRNAITRGANYADSAGEIRIKLYATRGDYSAADLNTGGDIDEYTNPTAVTGVVAIRLTGTQSALASTLPTLYVYKQDSGGNFTRLLNLADDFTHEGDFGGESDYLSHDTIEYAVGDTLRIYIANVEDRYSAPFLDIAEANLTAAVQTKLNRASGADDPRIEALEQKMTALQPLVPEVTDLAGWGSIYSAQNKTAGVRITQGYSLLADYRGSGTRYQSTGVVYDDTGANVIRYSGLTESLHRVFGMKVNAPADQVLLWLGHGASRIPFIRTTVGGVFQVNRYTPATTEDQRVENQTTPGTLTAGTAVITTASDSVATYTVTPYPANATQATRSIQIGLDVLLNGNDTSGEHLQAIDIPDTNTTQARTNVNASIYLGPLYNNRTVNITFSYELRVSGADQLVDFRLVSAPSDVTIRTKDYYTIRSYTAPATVARVDDWVTFNDGGGDYTYTGAQEFLVAFHPFPDLGTVDVVPAAVGSDDVVTELNDISVPIANETFSSVEVPDQAAVTGYEFRTFLSPGYLLHHDLRVALLNRATQWVYGFAESAGVTEHAVTEEVDFTRGIILTRPDAQRVRVTIDNTNTLVFETIV